MKAFVRAAAVIVLLLVCAGAAWWWLHGAATLAQEGAVAPLRYAGAQSCVQCHAAQAAQWQDSHHQLAMQAVRTDSVLAPFRGETFKDGASVSRFTAEGGRYFVATEGPDGRPGKFEITHTLGIAPLQQYLVAMPDGSLQALGTAWDARAQKDGGQRWYHLHAGEGLRAGDPLHWSGRQNNANFMCLDCHATGFRKNFDADKRLYLSSQASMGVSCEACHGPAATHVEWAQGSPLRRLLDSGKGLALRLDKEARAAYPRREVELCARCHAHRSQIDDSPFRGQPLMDTHVPSLLEKGLYHADGQMQGEVFNYAPFQQSRMYAKGVSCGDCHDVHTLKLRAPGNQVCLRCHAAPRFETSAHHFHAPGSSGAQCVNCHMPASTFMGVHQRHDHGLFVPRPDLAVKNGTPDACTKCHAGKDAAWAAAQALRWYPQLAQRPAPAALALQEEGAEALRKLSALLADTAAAPVVRATALARLPAAQDGAQFARLCAAAADAEPLVRKTAADALAEAPPAMRARCLLPLLADAIKAVRIAAARALAGLPQQAWSEEERERLARATNEYIAVQRYNADRPEAWNNLATLYAAQGRLDEAEQTLQAALAFAPDLAASALNLADIYRAQGHDEKAVALLAALTEREPRNAEAHYALGLAELRRHRRGDALKALQRAAELAPDNAQFAATLRLARESHVN